MGLRRITFSEGQRVATAITLRNLDYEHFCKDDSLLFYLIEQLLSRNFEEEAFLAAKKGELLGFSLCTACLGQLYLDGIGCQMDVIRGASLIVKAKDVKTFGWRWHDSYTLREVYIYGLHASDILLWTNWNETMIKHINGSSNYFTEVNRKVRRSTLCLLWCLTLSKLCSRDVARMIAKMVYQSRFEAEIWLFIS